MLCLTRIKRSYVIEHVMPSDLDDKDIKHGLYLKEKMIQEITDDYIKENFPNWKELERSYRRNGIADIADKLTCGEMSYSDVIKPKTTRIEVWMRYKKFNGNIVSPNILGYYFNDKFYQDENHTREIVGEEGKIYMDITLNDEGEKINQPYIWHPPKPNEEFGKYKEYYGTYQVYDFDRMDGYSDWIKADSNSEFNLDFSIKKPDPPEKALNDIMIQFQIAIIGENAIRYYPFQDASHYNGFQFVQDQLKIYDPQVWMREGDTSILKAPIDNQEEYYRFFFKNYKGYYRLDDELPFIEDYDEWIRNNYPNEKEVRTLQTDPFRLKYVYDDPRGTDCTIVAKQWIKTNYKSEMMNLIMFKVLIHNTQKIEE